MTDWTVTAAKVGPMPGQMTRRKELAVAASLGTMMYNNSSGKLAKADASAASTCKGQLYIIVAGPVKNQGGYSSFAIGDMVDACYLGPIPGFTDLDETKPYYVSDTAGLGADAPGTVDRQIGYPDSTEVFNFHPSTDIPS